MMNTIEPTHSIAIDVDSDFFAPVSADAIDGLLAKYNADLTNIRLVEDFMNGGAGGVVHYFAEGSKNHSGSSHHYYSTTFRADWAVEALKSAYWSRAIAMTDVMDYMPQKRRDEWRASIGKFQASCRLNIKFYAAILSRLTTSWGESFWVSA